MSFEEIWQEHKKFILTLAAGAAVFFAAYFYIKGDYDRQIRRLNTQAAAAKVKAERLKLRRGQLSEADAALESARTELDAIESELGYRAQDGFTLAGATRAPDIHFNEVVERMQSEIVEEALALGIRIQPDLGLEDRTPKTDAEREWFLNGLDVVYRISAAAIASGVRRVESIAIADPPSARRRRHQERPYLRELSVSFTAFGHPAAVDGLVRGLNVPTQRLAVDSATIASMDDPDGKVKQRRDEQTVQLTMRVKALLIDREGEPSTPKVTRL